MSDLAEILQAGAAADSPAWPNEETDFGRSMRRRANRLPQIPARLSMSNFLRGMFNAAADVNDFVWASRWGNRPGVVGMPDLVHTPGQEDYRPAPLGPQHIIAAGMGGVPPRGVPTEKAAYEAWQRQQEELRRAKVIASSPATPNASRPQDRGVPPAHWFPGQGTGTGEKIRKPARMSLTTPS